MGKLADAPELTPGEIIRLLHHQTELVRQSVFSEGKHPQMGPIKSVIVTLPSTTPFEWQDEPYFLRGFAVGKLPSLSFTFL